MVLRFWEDKNAAQDHHHAVERTHFAPPRYGHLGTWAAGGAVYWGTRAAGIRATVKGSRQRLRRDRPDIVLLHVNEHPVDTAGPVFGTLAALKAEGKIDGFGWSTDHPERLAAYATRDGFVAVENDYNVFTPARGVMA